MMTTRGIILAGGAGSRLYPMTVAISKQLIPIYDKPMIYYPICTLMQAGIRQMLVITTPRDLPAFVALLGNGHRWGVEIQYVEQPRPEGLGQAFILGREFIGDRSSALILGDNLFFGQGLAKKMKKAQLRKAGATIFAYHVANASRYGVIELANNGKAVSIEEKPSQPRSNYAVTGLYFYDNEVIDIAAGLKPSERGELEITDINKAYLKSQRLHVEILGRGNAWLDTGTPESLLEASQFIEVLENRQGIKIACPEEIAWQNGYIGDEDLHKLAELSRESAYSQYLLQRLMEGR